MSSYYFDKEAKRRINDSVTTFDVIRHLGIPTRKAGNRVSILCPNPEHNDHNYGSCSIDSRGNCYCYVCEKRFSPVDIMMFLGSYSLYDSLIQLADQAGILGEYLATEQPKINSSWLSREERKLIGLDPPRNSYKVIGTSIEKPKDGRPYIVYGEEYLLIEYLNGKDPLMDLYENDRESYIQLVISKMKEKKAFLDQYAREFGKEDASVREEYLQQIGILKKMAERLEGEE